MYFKNALLVSLVFALAGCVEAKNVSEVWGKATLDPGLEGKWKLHSFENNKDELDEAVLVKEGGYYLVHKEDSDEDMALRTISIDGNSFALFKPLNNTEGSVLSLYKLKNEKITFYDTEEKMQFENLDEAALKKIGEAFKDISKLKIVYAGEKVKI